jgi:hypothetical protein
MPEEVTQGGLAASSYADRTEHAKINGVDGKKVFNIDSSGNLVNPATSDNQTNGSQKTQIVETIPTDSTKLNGSVAITEVIVGTVTTKTIVKTIGSTTYTKTVATDSSDNSVTISSWA